MIIAAAQIRSFAGEVSRNLARHCEAVEEASKHGARLVAFPELSLTGYEPALAGALAVPPNDPCLNPLQELSNRLSLVIAVGIPLLSSTGTQIGMLCFQPNEPRRSYSKQWLHKDETPYFESGTGQLLLTTGTCRIAPAICFESLQPEHARCAARDGADLYLASVAKSMSGVERAFDYFPQVARQYGLTVLMVNSVGRCDQFLSVGQSAVWNPQGQRIGQLSADSEQLLCYDLSLQTAVTVLI